MNSSGDAAESIVRMSLQGIEVAARISGSGAKNIAVLLYTIMKDKQQTKGKTKLTNMLKSGKELKVFSVKQEDLKKRRGRGKGRGGGREGRGGGGGGRRRIHLLCDTI